MSTKHTPGPWNVDGIFICDDAGDRIVAEVPKMYDENDLANARLIAAAPELLEALQGLVRVNEEHNQSFIEVIGKPLNWKDDYLEAARAAIRKALGEEK